jgi:hypothetical protein
MVSVPHPDEWMADDGTSELGADGRRPAPAERRENGGHPRDDHAARDGAGFTVPGPGAPVFGVPGFGGQGFVPPILGVPEFGTQEHRSSLVRPYAVTGGRTKPSYQLQIEAMVSASAYEARDLSALSPECQSILGCCRDWRSVAEISAVLKMPLGVARVLIGDMAMEGLVRVHQADYAHGRPDLNLLERVLSGLRKL